MKINNLPDLITFVAVVDAMSFTQAAKELGISHSVVSKRISRLESELGAQLLQRTTRKLVLTEVGQALYERCSQIKKDIDEATLAVSATHDKPQGTLRINAPMSFGQLHLTPAVAAFIKAYPDINVELVLGRQYANLLEEGLDLSIQISDLPDSNLVARKLATRSTVICASPEYLAKLGPPKHPNELSHYNCLLYKHRKLSNDWKFLVNHEEKMMRVSGDLVVNSSQALVQAAKEGLGIVRVPGYLINREVRLGELVPILTEFCPRDIGIYAVYPHNRFLATKVKVFVEFLQKRFSTELYWNQI